MNRYSQSYESLVNIGTAFLHVDLLHHANCFICWQLGHSGPMSTPPSFSTAPSLSSLSEIKKHFHITTAPSLSSLSEKKNSFISRQPLPCHYCAKKENFYVSLPRGGAGSD